MPKNKGGKNGRNGKKSGYEVGYGRPPKATQFKPGQSGNPRGRPRGRRNRHTILLEKLYERIQARSKDGKLFKVSRLEASIESMINVAIKGDVGMQRLLAQSIDDAERQAVEFELLPSDRAVLERLLRETETPDDED